MKVAFIGNMNNNNFALMRYFRDIGIDAHLLLTLDDGKNTLTHFTPDADTWEIERWSPYIHQTIIPNSTIAALDAPLNAFLKIYLNFKSFFYPHAQTVDTVTREQIVIAFNEYDKLVGSGIMPSVLLRINRGLDLFYPYSSGIEFLGSYEFTSAMKFSGHRRFYGNIIRCKQLAGIFRAGCVVNPDGEITGKICTDLGINSKHMTIPMVYNLEMVPEMPTNAILADAFSAMQESNLTILHHARLMWQSREGYSAEENKLANKNCDWLIRAFVKLVNERPTLNPLLFVVEYGPDVEETKELVNHLGIQGSVKFLPKMARKELMMILNRVSIGVGEFYQSRCTLWGGTGWEVLSLGKPLLQGFNYNDGEFENMYGYPPPPMLTVIKEEDVLKQILFVADNPYLAKKIGQDALKWFNTYNGINLAKKWLHLLRNNTPVQNKTKGVCQK